MKAGRSKLAMPSVLTAEGRYRLRRDEVAASSLLLWSTFLKTLTLGPDAFLQGPDSFAKGVWRCAALAFLYESTVQKEGHNEYFRTKRRRYKYAPETITALRKLGGHCHADVLANAYNWVIADEYADAQFFDAAFRKCALPLLKVLETHFLENEADYIEWTE